MLRWISQMFCLNICNQDCSNRNQCGIFCLRYWWWPRNICCGAIAAFCSLMTMGAVWHRASCFLQFLVSPSQCNWKHFVHITSIHNVGFQTPQNCEKVSLVESSWEMAGMVVTKCLGKLAFLLLRTNGNETWLRITTLINNSNKIN